MPGKDGPQYSQRWGGIKKIKGLNFDTESVLFSGS
jgi:hypothetical protein